MLIVAQLLLDEPAYAPIFERLEAEIKQEKERLTNGPQSRARALLARQSIDIKKRSVPGGAQHPPSRHPDHNALAPARGP